MKGEPIAGGTTEPLCGNIAVKETEHKPKPILVRQIRRHKKAGFAKQYKVITATTRA